MGVASPDGGGDGKEIYYIAPAGQVMSAQIAEKGNSIEVSTPQVLFQSWPAVAQAPFDVTADGKKFIINTVAAQRRPLTLVVNWTAGLKK